MRKRDKTPPWLDPDRIAGVIAWATIAVLTALALGAAGALAWSAIVNST